MAPETLSVSEKYSCQSTGKHDQGVDQFRQNKFAHSVTSLFSPLGASSGGLFFASFIF